jgi:hypothetical protein
MFISLLGVADVEASSASDNEISDWKSREMWKSGRYELCPNELIPNVKIPNPKNGENPERKNPEISPLT